MSDKNEQRIDNENLNTSKPHLLIYAHYYDLASTAQIIRDLAEGMLESFRISVICVVPSYLGTIEEKWKKKKYYFETINGVEVIRVRVPEFSKDNKLSRVKNILTYFYRAMWITKKIKDVDYVMSVSQPPVLGGLLGVWGKWTRKNTKGQRAKFIYQIQDFNPEQVLAVNYSKNAIITNLMMTLDKFSCKQSDLVITVGRDLIETLRNRFNNEKKKIPKHVLINNWIDEKEIYPLSENNARVLSFKKRYQLEDKFIFMYSGNIGLYYDLENLIKVVENFKPGTKTKDGREIAFVFVGDGTVLDSLKKYVKQHQMDNVTFIPYQEKKDLIYSLNAGDVHWCVNTKGIKGVSCPSKYYGLAAVGKPILGVLEEKSEVRCLIEETQGGLVSNPGEYSEVKKNIQWFIENADNSALKKMGQNGHKYLMENLTKDLSVRKYAKEILNT